jgi:hypothetical protein
VSYMCVCVSANPVFGGKVKVALLTGSLIESRRTRTSCIDKAAFQNDCRLRTCICTSPSTDPKTTPCLADRLVKAL